MQISKQKPKCWDKLVAAFPGISWESGIVITYGGQIHCIKGQIAPDLEVHEMVHVEQQKGIDADEYVDRFINDREFRLKVEIEAYQKQAAFVNENVEGRDARWNRIHHIRTCLCDPMFGLTYNEAYNLIEFAPKRLPHEFPK